MADWDRNRYDRERDVRDEFGRYDREPYRRGRPARPGTFGERYDRGYEWRGPSGPDRDIERPSGRTFGAGYTGTEPAGYAGGTYEGRYGLTGPGIAGGGYGGGYGSFGERYATERPPFESRGREGRRGLGPKTFTRSDERIYDEVCCLLTDSDAVDATNIEVKVEKGEVTLSGTVDSRDQKRRAEDLAEDVRGVKDVLNQIRVAG